MSKGAKVLNTDVLVVGGGVAGFAAAIASARAGGRTILVERYGFLGGAATAGLVGPFMVSRSSSGEFIESPIFLEVIDELEARGSCLRGELFDQPHIAFDPEVLKTIILEKVLDAGVSLYLHSFAGGVILKEERFSGVTLESKSGQFRIFSKVTVDSTGDADLAWMSGAPFKIGREKDGLMQPATLFFRVGGVDASKMPAREEMDRIFLKARDDRRVNVPREKLLWFETTREGELLFNVTRVTGVDGTKVEDLTRAEVSGRKQVSEVFDFLKSEVPGFAGSHIVSVAPQIGIRESRRIVGEYLLTEDDVMRGADFPDVIAKCSYPVDIHDPKGKSTTFKPLTKPYDIPYRCLVPKRVENLLVAGRPISVDHVAHSSTRVMPTCMAVGEAAGIAAALSVKKKCSPKHVDVGAVQDVLAGLGANYV
jgi:hypothetical protein